MTITVRPTPRRIALDGPLNTRDLGGLPLIGGGATRFGIVLRSDAPTQLSERDLVLLSALGLTTVIDLRTDEERRRFGGSPLSDAPVDHHHLPLLDGDVDRGAWNEQGDLLVLYRHLLHEAGDRLVGVLRVLSTTSGATLVHCAAGKDRTGVVAAVALLLVGVRRAAVVADYTATEAFLPAMRLRYSDWDDAAPIAPALFAAPASVMEALVDHIGDRHGGAVAWATAHGWTAEDQERLASRLADPMATPLPPE